MLARTSKIRHRPSGVTLTTPLLIPSFSSKGFARSQNNKKSEVIKILKTASEFITETCLISAYDIYYKHIPNAEKLPCNPTLLFLDSGGYEISRDRDYSSVIDPLPAPEPWSIKKWHSIVDSWPEELPAVIISYDHHKKRYCFDEQVELAIQRFKKCGDHLLALLLKPETGSQEDLTETLNAARSKVTTLSNFDIIGVTEKELGNSMLDRMAQIARLRKAMDDEEVNIPIHIFGALDPISVCLYFVAGAEIFDGLTWIRYGYHEGNCVYTHNMGVLRFGIGATDNLIKSRALAENYYYLQNLKQYLQEYEETKKWDKLTPNHLLVKNAWDSLRTRLKKG
ncbi:hypothetical protein ACFL54_04150 [Planctomycetota bacterium]